MADSSENITAQDVLALKIAQRVSDAYARDGQTIGRLCDETIDRSGNLLGWVRDYTRNGAKP